MSIFSNEAVYFRVWIKVKKRLLTTILAIIVFATLFSAISYVPSSQREPNVYYFGFLETFLFVVIYSGPVYFLVGLPASIIIDRLVRRLVKRYVWKKYFIQLGLYSLAGVLAGFVLSLFSGGTLSKEEVLPLAILGLAAAIIYFHVSLLVSKIRVKEKQQASGTEKKKED
ncbi:hypothetical protein [Virgibacillus sp. SK37]|uniref:hypothetical protein n=1 Tax=Virgibacillus sp. SK37 TaxID=403957 RepID=UPI0004D1D8D4|nr:hypothetical protein [Virgibacillus sp. SK37]AIF45270.1 hypothetical protein X953_06315 [Virgibacillus sp. SK37]